MLERCEGDTVVVGVLVQTDKDTKLTIPLPPLKLGAPSVSLGASESNCNPSMEPSLAGSPLSLPRPSPYLTVLSGGKALIRFVTVLHCAPERIHCAALRCAVHSIVCAGCY